MSGRRVQRRFEELRTREVELELENEELRQQRCELERQNAELARARDELVDLSDRAPVGSVTAAYDGLLLGVNLRFAALLGQTRSCLLGRPLSAFIARDDQDIYFHHRRMLEETGERQVCELRMLRASGKIFWASLESIVVSPASGARVSSTVRDITRRRHAEEEQRRLRECLDQSQKMEAIGTLAGGVAHDVNNILAVIMALGSRLERSLPKGDASWQDVRDIVAAVFRGKKLTQDLLDFAHQGPRRIEVCSPNDVVGRLRSILERTAPKRIRIELALEDELACVECDPRQLTHVLMNTCLNSIDAIAAQGAIVITTRNLLQNDAELCGLPELSGLPHVLIDVSDNGSGMDEETRRRAFEPFFTTKDVGAGTGLGLSIVYAAVHELGGDVRIISEINHGTTLRIVLPACQSVATRRSWIPAKGQSAVPGGTVLVVDDEAMVRHAFERVLEGLGYRVLAAEDGPSALRLYEAHAERIDVVLLDMSMPVMDGAECYARLKQVDPNVRVVICTGRAPTEAAQRLFGQDPLHLVSKPCSPDELASALAAAVQTTPRVTH